MRLASIRPGDLVLIDRRGRRFHALVMNVSDRELTIAPIERGISYRTARARDIEVHWRRAGRTRPRERGETCEQEALL